MHLIDIQHRESLRCTMCWSDILLYHKMMTTIALANISIQSHHHHFFFMMRTFKISLSSLSWETWWNCTVSTHESSIPFFQKFLNLDLENSWSHCSVFLCCPSFGGYAMVPIQCNDFWQRPQAVACSLLLCLLCLSKIRYWEEMENLLYLPEP